MNKSIKIIDSAVLAGLVLFVGAAASWYLAVPLGLAGIYFILKKKPAFRDFGSQPRIKVVDLDDPNDSSSIVNSYHRLLHHD